MSGAQSLLQPSILQRLIGVIDLRGGLAVHAIAGRRDRYQLVQIKRGGRQLFTPGDASGLARHYHELGIRRLYVADLDAITQGQNGFDSLDRLLEHLPEFDELLIDYGLRGDEVAEVPTPHYGNTVTRWIIATESSLTTDAIARLCDWLSPDRVMLGLDYRGGEFLCCVANELAWIENAVHHRIHGFIPLDVNVVGTRNGTCTETVCRRLNGLTPRLKIYSGGGVRGANDVKRLLQSGCDRILVATALHDIRAND